jgi:hypothetical protein
MASSSSLLSNQELEASICCDKVKVTGKSPSYFFSEGLVVSECLTAVEGSGCLEHLHFSYVAGNL